VFNYLAGSLSRIFIML
jgi:hypothetical protein